MEGYVSAYPLMHLQTVLNCAHVLYYGAFELLDPLTVFWVTIQIRAFNKQLDVKN